MRSKRIFLALAAVAGLNNATRADDSALLASSKVRPRHEFEIKTEPAKNLLNESQALVLTAEESVQTEDENSTMRFGFLAGGIQTNSFGVSSQGRPTHYPAAQAAPFITAAASAAPVSGKFGRLGGLFSVGYGYLEQHERAPATAIHLIPIEAALLFRGEWKDAQKVIPYVAFGADDLVYVQRGLEQYNTSGSVWAASLTAGMAFNLNQIFGWRSRVRNEFQAQYRSILPVNNSDSGWKMDAIQIGTSFSL
jgi:hypothetical protein